jgi:hypothetical protein
VRLGFALVLLVEREVEGRICFLFPWRLLGIRMFRGWTRIKQCALSSQIEGRRWMQPTSTDVVCWAAPGVVSLFFLQQCCGIICEECLVEDISNTAISPRSCFVLRFTPRRPSLVLKQLPTDAQVLPSCLVIDRTQTVFRGCPCPPEWL